MFNVILITKYDLKTLDATCTKVFIIHANNYKFEFKVQVHAIEPIDSGQQTTVVIDNFNVIVIDTYQ